MSNQWWCTLSINPNPNEPFTKCADCLSMESQTRCGSNVLTIHKESLLISAWNVNNIRQLKAQRLVLGMCFNTCPNA